MPKLNIGAGHSYIPGFTNIDISPSAEVMLDLSTDSLPFDDDSVDLIFSYHTLEHIPDYLRALGEIHRVLKHGAPLLVGVPYVSLTYFHQVNPYHLHDFNESSFDFFDPHKLRGSAAEDATETHSILFQKAFHRYHYMGIFQLFPPPLRGWCRRHLLNTVRKIDFGLIALKDEQSVVQFDGRSLKTEFDRLLAARVQYEPRVEETPMRQLAKRGYRRMAGK